MTCCKVRSKRSLQHLIENKETSQWKDACSEWSTEMWQSLFAQTKTIDSLVEMSIFLMENNCHPDLQAVEEAAGDQALQLLTFLGIVPGL